MNIEIMASVLMTKSEDFAVRIINLYNYLSKEKSEHTMSKQILRAGTSIGANIAEAQEAFSKADFLSKIFISLKECSESHYWLRILRRTDYITKFQFDSLSADCTELLRMLTAATKTTRQNLQNEKK